MLVVMGAGFGYAAAAVSSGKLKDALLVASTTLVFGALLGGAVKFLLEDLQRLRERREENARFVKQILDEVQSVSDRVERVRILIAAHRSALTYGKEMRDLINSAVQLRNVTRALDQTSEVIDKCELKLAVGKMTAYLNGLTSEFRDEYKEIADEQNLYEAQAKQARESNEPLPDNTPWDRMSHLPNLTEFLSHPTGEKSAQDKPTSDFQRDFRDALDAATWILHAELRRFRDGLYAQDA